MRGSGSSSKNHKDKGRISECVPNVLRKGVESCRIRERKMGNLTRVPTRDF